MSVESKPENPMKAAVSVSSLCRLLKMSRSQFYFHVKRGTFHAPLRLPSNSRPYYTASMVEDILKARETGVGVNGEFVIWYERQHPGTRSEPKKPKADHSSLLEGLERLGLGNVTEEQVERALAACYPKGTTGQDEAIVLRAVFRHLKRSGSA
jgi:predicted DNA-binding transcriptional regulator AlpA